MPALVAARFKAMLLSIWLAEALDDPASFRRFCGFSLSEPTPERTAFVRFRKALVVHGLDKILFDAITGQLKTRLDAWNQPVHRIRGRIEKIFGTWKRSNGLRRMRWRGLAKAAEQIRLTAIAYT